MQSIILATRNKGKIAELSEMLESFHLEVKGLDAYPEIGEIEETGTTFAENAMIKAKVVSQATGLVAIADDSGLEVDVLNGQPGVYSARYSADVTSGKATDASNNEKLLRELKGVPSEKRSARFRCSMAACAPGGETLTAEGAWEGSITQALQGTNGFGYDPLFYDASAGMVSAEMSKEQKNARSHRGIALRKLLEQWPDFWQNVEKSLVRDKGDT